MNLAPGPRTFREKLASLRKRRADVMHFYADTIRTYGDVSHLAFGKLHFLMVNDPDAIEQVLKTDAKLYIKSASYERFRLIFGNGLLISDGDVWRKQRARMASAFTAKTVEAGHPIMVDATARMIDAWTDGVEFDLAEELNRVTLRIITETMLERLDASQMDIIRTAVPELLRYLQTTHHHVLMAALSFFPVKDKVATAIRIESMLPLPGTKRFFKAIKQIDDLVNGIIARRRTLNLNENLLDRMIQATDSEGGDRMTDLQLRDEVVNILLAGHETTANALSWTVHMILKHPEVYDRMTAEIRSVVKGRMPTYDEVEQLPYTLAVFQEALRLYPPFWRISRRATVDTKVGDYDVPAGTNVIISIFTVQRDPRFWKDPLEFRPERFLEGTEEKTHRFAYLPFGGGPRICIGSHMAANEAVTILAGIFRNVDVEKAFTEDPTFLLSITMQPKEGCDVRIRKTDI